MNLQVYVINLDESLERLASATEQLQAADMEFERVSAFDGRRLEPTDHPEYSANGAVRYLGRSMRGGEIGCYISHLNCNRKFLHTQAEACLVLEDDVRLQPDFASGVEQILSWLSKKETAWDVVHLAPTRHKIYTPILELSGMSTAYVLTRAHYFPMRTTALLWSRSGANAFVQEHQRIFAPIDIYLRYRLTRNDCGLAIWPPLATTTGADSEVAGSLVAKRSSFRRHPFYTAIRLYRMTSDKVMALRNKIQGLTRLPR